LFCKKFIAMNDATTSPTTVLYRPVGRYEYELISDSGFRAFPPRQPQQPIFYPVLEFDYAAHIARDWNTHDAASGFHGYVLRFRVRSEFLARHEVRPPGWRSRPSGILDPSGGTLGLQCEHCRSY
jgi:hypothetical protein